MSCQRYLRAIEDELDQLATCAPESGPDSPPLSAALRMHVEGCRRCARTLQSSWRARRLLAALREESAGPAVPAGGPGPEDWREPPQQDALFLAAVKARIARARKPERGVGGLRVRWRDLGVAGAVFVFTLAGFIYDVHRTESPDISEAEALDVPHVHWRHPSDDHTAGATDVLLSLLNP